MMYLVIRKAALLGCGIGFCVLAAFAGILCAGYGRFLPVSGTEATGSAAGGRATVVIDPGHGGEDGGAVSPEGVAESGINLAVSLRVYDLLRFCGQTAVLTRTEDVSIGDPSLPTVRQRKASDIRRRVEEVNSLEKAILLSIHQNSLPSSPVTHGAQVFWNRQKGGEALAKQIQSALNEEINAGNEKEARAIDPSIYLMKHAAAPAALVECGFLSNAAETMQLLEAAYQTRLAVAISAGYMRYASEEGRTA